MSEETLDIQVRLADLYACVQIIDVCTERGAFKGNELELIGGVRNRLEQFVKANEPDEAKDDNGDEEQDDE